MAKQAEEAARQEIRDLLKEMESHSEKTADALASLDTLAQASASSGKDAVATLNATNQNLTAQSIANQGIRQSLQQTARPILDEYDRNRPHLWAQNQAKKIKLWSRPHHRLLTEEAATVDDFTTFPVTLHWAAPNDNLYKLNEELFLMFMTKLPLATQTLVDTDAENRCTDRGDRLHVAGHQPPRRAPGGSASRTPPRASMLRHAAARHPPRARPDGVQRLPLLAPTERAPR